jgi:hypothetical protein
VVALQLGGSFCARPRLLLLTGEGCALSGNGRLLFIELAFYVSGHAITLFLLGAGTGGFSIALSLQFSLLRCGEIG